MHQSNMKYAFLTTYNQTVFLRQEEHPGKKGEWVLWYSNVIKNGTASIQVSSVSPRDFHGKVSLRECFLFLAVQGASNNWYAKNEMHVDSWATTRPTFRIAKRERITDDVSQSTPA